MFITGASKYFINKLKSRIQGVPWWPGAKDSVMSLLWLRFGPWPRNFHMPWARKGEKKKKKELRCQRSRDKEEREHLSVQGKFLSHWVSLPHKPRENILSLIGS